ncbi:Fe-S cluster assembly ATPase SufC [Francisellaceae bacterium]|nr:Fe-S cluster assembly ATPase SufC [Francisellaceae bacterium]
MLKIRNLHATVEDKAILKGLSLEIKPGEVHAIMGPNGSGKSTLSNIIAGNDNYVITEGSIEYQGKDLLELDVAERAAAGIFLGFQYPVEIAGVSNVQFIKTAVNSVRKANGLEELDAMNFMKILRQKMQVLKMDQKFMKRGVNEGFSGGEKKRNEMLQMMMLEPSLCILDETDSGLDIDALQVVAESANHMRDEKRSFIVITHYQRLLNYIKPDYVHVLSDGKIIRSGDESLSHELEAKGYSWISETA